MFTLLYVDDEPGLLELGKLFLESTGEFAVTTALSGDEGLGLLAKQDFDAIVSDFQMPVIDGIELLKRVRKSFGPVPFVLFTGRGREEVVIEAINNGVDFYLQKGGDPRAQFAELALKVRQAVNRRRAEAALSESEKRLSDIINFLPDATFAIDTGGRVIAWNRAIEEMTGIEATEILGRTDYEYAVPFYGKRRPILIDLVGEPDEKIAEGYTNIRRDGKMLSAETDLATVKGQRIYVLAKASPLYNRDGKITGAIEAIRDISDRKRAEDERNESERRFRDLAELLPQGIYEADTAGRVTYANRLAQEMYGYNDEDIRNGLDLITTIVPEERERVSAGLQRILQEETSGKVSAEYRVLRKDGTIFPVAIYSSPIVRDGRIKGIRGIIIDITDRKKAEEELRAANEQLVASEEELRSQYDELALSEKRIRESEEKYRTVFETTGTAMLMIEEDTTISLANEEFCRMSGFTREEIENKKRWMEFVVPEDRERMVDRHRQRRIDPGHTLKQYEFRFVTRSKETRDILLFIDILPGTTKSVASLLDITERKRASDELQAANEQLVATDEELRAQYEDLAESEKQLRLLKISADRSSDQVFWLDTEGNFLYVNEAACRDYGYTREEFSRMKIYDLNPDVTAEIWRRSVEDLREHETHIITTRHRRKDGSFLDVEILGVHVNQNDREFSFAYVRDITERKKMEAAIRESEEKYRTLVENIPFGITLIDADHRIIISNAAQGQMFHTDAGLWPGRFCYQEFEKRDAVCAHCPGTRAMATGACHVVETEGVRDDGTRFNARIHAIPLPDVVGRATRFIEVVEDITERKKAEDALRQNEEKYRALVETTGTGYVILDQEGRVLDANPEYVRLTGHAGLDEIAGRSVTEWTAEYERERNAEAVRQCLRDGSIRNFEVDYAGRNGTITPIEVNATVLRTGGSVQILTLCREISERRKTETAIKSRAEEYRDILRTAMDGFCIINLDWSFADVNETFCRMLGYPREEVMALSLSQVEACENPEETQRHIRKIIDEGEDRFETRWRRKGGDLIDVEVSAIHSGAHGGQLFTFSRDITERKRAGDELLRLKISTDHSSDEVFWMDFAGNILYVNDAACRITGYSREEFLKMKIFELDPEFQQEVWDASVADLRERRTQFITTRHRRRDGSIMDVEIVAVYVSQYDKEYSFAYVRDVTERKRTEEALFNSRQMLQAVLDSIPQRVFWKDRNSVFLGCNKLLALDGGFSDPAELVGKTDYDTASRATAELYRSDDRQVMETGQPRINFEEPQVRPDGSPAWLRTTKVPLRNRAGEIIGILGTYEDITERKRTEEALRESEEKYRSLVESSFDGIVIHQEGILVYLNRTAARILGSDDPDAFIGKHALDVVAPEFRQQIEGRVQQASQQDLGLIHEKFLRIDGSAVDVDVTTTPTKWNGKPAAYVTFRDISAQIQAEEALRESEEKYRTLVESSFDGILIHQDGIVAYINQTGARLYGSDDPDAIIGRPAIDLIAPACRPLVTERMRESPEKPLGLISEQLLRLDGTVFDADVTTTPTTWKGKPAAYVTFRDITMRKKAEEALRESEARLSSILHGSPVLQFVIGRDHRVISWNRALEEYSGIRAEEIIGTDEQWRAFYPTKRQVLADILVDGDMAALDELYAGKYRKSRYVEGAYEANDFFPHMGRAGKWLSFTAAPVRDVNGTVIGAVETLEDVTERINAANALRESEEWTRTILNSAQAGIVLVDAVSHVIVHANRKALELIGLDRDSVIGTVCHCFICPAEKGKCPVTDLYQKVDTSERVLLTATGETIPVLKTVVPVTIHGRSMLVESFVDISDQKRSETAVREANRKINLLNSITRHDIRNQLMVAQGFAQLAAMTKPDPAILDFLHKITDAIETIQRQIEFTKTYQELGVHAPAWFAVDEVVSSVRPEQIVLKNTCRAVEIYADPMIDKVFFNLFHNAVKHGERVTEVTVGCEEIDEYLVITFADNGIGIPDSEKKKIFEEGYRKRTGHGLFLVREILSITGITIFENGTPGEGAVFEILVPKGAYRKAG